MSEIIQLLASLKDQLNTLLGGLVAMAGFMLQHKISQKSQQKKMLLEKVEGAYTLCQKSYDGHLREILLFEQQYAADAKMYLMKRKHPGQEVSDFKMLIRCYFPEAEDALSEFDLHHKYLKNKFVLLDKAASDFQIGTPEECKNSAAELRQHLENFGHACNIIKALLTEKARKTTR